MGLIADILRNFGPRNAAPPMPMNSQWSTSQPQTQYMGYARAYQANEIVFAAIEMLATSVGEPTIVGRKWQRNSPRTITTRAGPEWRDENRRDIRAGFYRDLTDHPLVKLLENPNPMMSSDDLWGNVIMDRAIAGNAYLLKVRQPKPFRGIPMELWRLRPDRVKVIPKIGGVEAYEYNTGTDKVRYPAEDVLHFKTRNPLNDYYGQPTLLAIGSRIEVDDYMKNFLRSFFERGGASGPGSILTVKQKVSQEAKDEIRERFRQRYGNNPGELLILDNAESTYQQMGLNRGLRDALPAELDSVSEARIAMAFGIPGSILGLKIGYESSSYANKRQDWQVYWDVTMAPLLASLAAELNLKIVPEFSGIDEVVFSLGDIRALQEDVDLLHKRHRDNLQFGLESWQEAREAIGLDPNPSEGIFFVPSNMVPTEVDILGEPPEPVVAPKQIAAPAEPMMDVIDELRHTCGKLLGKDIAGNPLLWCPRCKVDVRARDMVDKPHVVVKTVERDLDGKIARVLEVVS